MVAGFYVFDIYIPDGNGYATDPEAVKDRVVPHLKQMEPFADLEPTTSNSEWVLTAPAATAGWVVRVVEDHYGFEFTQREGFITK